MNLPGIYLFQEPESEIHVREHVFASRTWPSNSREKKEDSVSLILVTVIFF